MSGSRPTSRWLATLRGIHGARRCAMCNLAVGNPLCESCEADFFDAARPRCRRCAIALARVSIDLCGRCAADPPEFEQTSTLGDYCAPIDGMIAAMKFSARLDLAVTFGQLLAQREASALAGDTLVIPVPLAFERESERGFNQSLEIARVYARLRGLQLADRLLVRTRHTPPQQNLRLEERRRNVKGAFALAARTTCDTIVVVDDVMTSGSTLNEIARTLKSGGIRTVVNRIVARTP